MCCWCKGVGVGGDGVVLDGRSCEAFEERKGLVNWFLERDRVDRERKSNGKLLGKKRDVGEKGEREGANDAGARGKIGGCRCVCMILYYKILLCLCLPTTFKQSNFQSLLLLHKFYSLYSLLLFSAYKLSSSLYVNFFLSLPRSRLFLL